MLSLNLMVSRRAWWQKVFLVIGATLLLTQLAGLLGTKLIVPLIGWSEEGIQPADELVDTFEGRFARWDSGYYLQIAKSGYRPDGSERAFFPLYPMLISLLEKMTGLSLCGCGTIISILCFLGSGLLLYKWALIDHDPNIAIWSVIWLCIFPMSFFFSAIYTESVFLLTSLAALYFARRGNFIVSGLAIAIAGFTRIPAFLLAIPYVLEFWKQRNFTLKQWGKFIGGAFVAPLGMLLYFFYLGFLAGNMDLFAVYTSNQSLYWDRSFSWPWITLYDGIKAAFLGENIEPDWFSRVLVWQDLMYALLGFAFALWGLFRLRASTWGYLMVNVLFVFINHGPYGYAFWSVPRYVMVIIPIYPLLAIASMKIPYRYRWILPSASMAALMMYSAWFATGRWVS